jgi:hypothetical protein
MRTLCVQFQPRRASGLAIKTVSTLMLKVAMANSDVRAFAIHRGGVSDPYVNYLFASRTIVATWKILRAKALANRKLGSRLRRAMIVTGQGSRGWDNYLLLHHFDSEQVLDKLAGL